MKMEYILVKAKDDYCITKEQLINLLKSNARINSISEERINIRDSELKYSVTVRSPKDKEKEIIFILSVETETADDKMVGTMEEIDKIIHSTTSMLGNRSNLYTLWDDVSIHYAQESYPKINHAENLLRKLIYRFMINIAGGDWFEKTVPVEVKEHIKNIQDKSKIPEEQRNENQLSHADFIQLSAFLFAKYPLKTLNEQSLMGIKKSLKDKNGNLDEVFEKYVSKSNWERYFSNRLKLDNLSEEWNQLYIFRNKVAHSKTIRNKDYSEAMDLIDKLSNAFIECLKHVDDIILDEEETNAVKEVVKGISILDSLRINDEIGRNMPQDYILNPRYPSTIGSQNDKWGDLVIKQNNISGINEGILQYGLKLKLLPNEHDGVYSFLKSIKMDGYDSISLESTKPEEIVLRHDLPTKI